jgi:hypothetical protein
MFLLHRADLVVRQLEGVALAGMPGAFIADASAASSAAISATGISRSTFSASVCVVLSSAC